MNIGSTQATSAAIEGIKAPENKRAGLQLALLKKSLESQQTTMEQLMNTAQGKGQNIDIRV